MSMSLDKMDLVKVSAVFLNDHAVLIENYCELTEEVINRRVKDSSGRIFGIAFISLSNVMRRMCYLGVESLCLLFSVVELGCRLHFYVSFSRLGEDIAVDPWPVAYLDSSSCGGLRECVRASLSLKPDRAIIFTDLIGPLVLVFH